MMKLSKSVFAIVLAVFLSTATALVAQEAASGNALQKGYRTGYSDGYMAGYRDAIDNQSKNLGRHSEYGKADRAYSKEYGTLEEYRDGYQQGFEAGYGTGYEKRSFEAAVPAELNARGVRAVEAETTSAAVAVEPTAAAPQENSAASIPTTQASVPAETAVAAPVQSTYAPTNDAVVVIPKETELLLELSEDLSTERNREGDKFVAKIVGPSEIAGAIVEGRVSKVTKPGRLKRRSEMTLTFDRIVLNDQRWTNFGAILTEVMPVKGDNIKRIDNEGTAIGKSSIKSDAIKVGGATGAGLVVGGIAGGPVGAAVGAGVGAAFGVGAAVVERGKHISLNKNQQLRIKTSYESQIR
jgi:hypothetical protein